MLAALNGLASDRKLWHFACGCALRGSNRLPIEFLRPAVEVAERYADGNATRQELRVAFVAAHRAAYAFRFVAFNEVKLLERTAAGAAKLSGVRAAEIVMRWTNRMAPNPAVLADLLRCLFNPFQPPAFDSSWRTPTAVALALVAYTERQLPSGSLDPTRLLILADALEEAGCTNAALHAHLRSPGPHVRGCWPVDLILDRA
jgi:hypothetical protein